MFRSVVYCQLLGAVLALFPVMILTVPSDWDHAGLVLMACGFGGAIIGGQWRRREP